MASVKLATLAIRTIAKPISEQLKTYAKSNQRFRTFCIGLAQNLWKAEIRLRETLLGEVHAAVKPLNDAKAIQNGSTFLAEGFLFSVAASLIIAETWRSSRSQSKRRDDVDDRIDDLEMKVKNLVGLIEGTQKQLGDAMQSIEEQGARNEELSRVIIRIVDIGLRGGWAEFESSDNGSRLKINRNGPILLPTVDLDRLKPRRPLPYIPPYSDVPGNSTTSASQNKRNDLAQTGENKVDDGVVQTPGTRGQAKTILPATLNQSAASTKEDTIPKSKS